MWTLRLLTASGGS